MEYILGGLGALCCGITIGGIGYGLYRCCTKNDLTTEIEKYNKVYEQHGGIANMMVFDVKKTNEQEIQFEITAPLDLRRFNVLFGKNNDQNFKDLPEFPQIINDIYDKKTNSIAHRCYKKNRPYSYQLTFTISQQGEITQTRCGALDRNIQDAKLWNRENMKRLLNILKLCVWSRKMTKGKPFFTTTLNDNLVSLYDIIDKYQNKELFDNIYKNISKFYSTTSPLKEDDDVIIRRSYLSLTDVNNDKKKDEQDVMSVN